MTQAFPLTLPINYSQIRRLVKKVYDPDVLQKTKPNSIMILKQYRNLQQRFKNQPYLYTSQYLPKTNIQSTLTLLIAVIDMKNKYSDIRVLPAQSTLYTIVTGRMLRHIMSCDNGNHQTVIKVFDMNTGRGAFFGRYDAFVEWVW